MRSKAELNISIILRTNNYSFEVITNPPKKLNKKLSRAKAPYGKDITSYCNKNMN